MPSGRAKAYALTTILVPTDFSPGSQAGLDHAVALAGKTKANIVLLHVIETIATTMKESLDLADFNAVAKSLAESPQMMDVYALVRRAVEPALDQLVQSLKTTNVAASSQILQGTAHEQIVAHAKQIGADLIVMGTHGRRGVSHLFIGSVAERVVRTSPCPVLTVRTSGEHEL